MGQSLQKGIEKATDRICQRDVRAFKVAIAVFKQQFLTLIWSPARSWGFESNQIESRIIVSRFHGMDLDSSYDFIMIFCAFILMALLRQPFKQQGLNPTRYSNMACDRALWLRPF